MHTMEPGRSARAASSGGTVGALRRDAQRNRDAIVAAARELFSEHGLDAPLEQIARRAGVGIGTLYRRFPSRADLVDAILADAVQVHLEIVEQALAMDDPWDGFVHFLEQTLRLEATDRGFNDMMSMCLPGATAAEAAKARILPLVVEVIQRAQRSGQLRADFTPQDLAFLSWSNAGIAEATAGIAPDAWRRQLGFLLDGFRAENAGELPEPPLSPEQVHRAMLTLGLRCSGCDADA